MESSHLQHRHPASPWPSYRNLPITWLTSRMAWHSLAVHCLIYSPPVPIPPRGALRGEDNGWRKNRCNEWMSWELRSSGMHLFCPNLFHVDFFNVMYKMRDFQGCKGPIFMRILWERPYSLRNPPVGRRNQQMRDRLTVNHWLLRSYCHYISQRILFLTTNHSLIIRKCRILWWYKLRSHGLSLGYSLPVETDRNRDRLLDMPAHAFPLLTVTNSLLLPFLGWVSLTPRSHCREREAMGTNYMWNPTSQVRLGIILISFCI